MKDNISTLYGALKNKGYTDIGKDETEFRDWLGKEGNVKTLYGALSQQGFDDIGDEQQFTDWIGVSPKTETAAQRMNKEPMQPYTHEYDDKGKLVGGTAYEAPEPYNYKPEVQDYILQNKPDMFKQNKSSLMDIPLSGSADAPELSDEKFESRIGVAQKNAQDPSVQKARNEARLRGLSSSVDADLADIEEKIVNRTKALRGTPWVRDDRGLAQYRGERSYLEGAKELLEESQKIVDAVKAEKDGTFLGGVARGVKDTAFDVDTWTMGISDLVGGLRLRRVLEDYEAGKELTPAQEKLLDAAITNMATSAWFESDLGRGYKAGQVTGESLPFMLEMMVNPISASGNAMAKSLLTAGLKRFGSVATNKAVKAGTRLATDALAATGMAATTGLPGVLGESVDRMNRNYEYGFDNDGNLNVTKTGNTSFGEALGRSFTTRAIENQSEMIFNAFKSAGQLFRGAERYVPGGVNKFFDWLGNSQVGQAWRSIKNSPLRQELMKAAQIGGIGEEYLEEVYNNLANFAIGEMSWEDVVDLDRNIDTFLGLAPTQVMFSMIGLGGMAAERYQTRKDINRLREGMTEEQQAKLNELLSMGTIARNVDVRGYIRGVMADESLTPEQKRASIEAAYDVAKQNAVEQIAEAETEDAVDADNAQIDSVTDPSTGMYTEVERIMVDESGETVRQPGYVVGWIGSEPVFVPEGVDNVQENRIVLKPNEWDPSTLQSLENGRVKALNEEMIREEAAVQAERESKYSPEVVNYVPQPQDQVTDANGQVLTVAGVTPDGVTYLDEQGQANQIPLDAWRDLMQAQIDLQEAQQAQADRAEASNQSIVDNLQPKPMNDGTGRIMQPKAVEGNKVIYDITDAEGNVLEEGSMDVAKYNEPLGESSGESVGEEVNSGVNNSVVKENLITEKRPMSEEEASGESVSPVEVEQPKAPVIPTKEDGSVDFVAYGKEGSFKVLGERYGEKMPNKVAVTAKAFADDVAKAQAKLDKAEEAYDNAPIGREQKAEQARDKARQELEAVKREADFWAEMDAEIKAAQQRREDVLNPRIAVESSNEPMTTDEFVAQQLAAGNIVLNKDDYMRETGYGGEEANAMNGGGRKLFAEEGMTIQEAGERLMEMDRESGTNFFDQSDSNAGRDALISLLGSVRNRKELNGYIAEKRKEQAQRDAEGLRNEAERSVMDANFSSLEDFVLQMEAAEMENPFADVDLDRIDAIFAEAEEEYQNFINNEQGRTSEIAEGNDNVLSEEQSDDTGGTEGIENEGESGGNGEGTLQQNEGAHVGEQGSEVVLEQQEGETILQFAERAAEEQRRRPLRKRVKEWENLLGVKVNVIERPEDVKNKEALRYIAKGDVPSGWVESNGEVSIYLPGVPNVAEVDKTIIHEVIAHRGLPGLLGRERFNELCDKVWDMMPESKRTEYYEYVGDRFDNEQERQRAAADEYMAFLAEGVDLSPQDKSVWQEIVKYIRSVIESVMGKTSITDKDIEELLRASFARFVAYKQAVDARGGQTRFRFSKSPQEFDAVQKEAVEKKGIVMPGLNEAVVDVLGIDKHDFNGNLKQAREEAKQWAIENYQGKEFALPDDGGLYTIGKKAINKYVDKTSIEKSDNAMIHLSALKELPNIISSSVTGEIHADYKKGENGERSAENGVGDKGLLVHRMFGAIELDGKVYRVKTTMNEYINGKFANTPHSYEVTEIELIEDSTTDVSSNPLNRSNNSITAAKLLNGVEKSYDKGKKLLDESENIRFRVTKESQAIIDKAKADGTYMKAPNGEPTNLNENQWAQVRTKAFKKWFGDWENEPEKASKIVDENGEPMVVFHQTEKLFTVFNPYHRGAGKSDYETPFGIFMKPTSRNIGIKGGVQMPLYSSISNPLVVKDRKHLSRWLSDNIEGYTETLDNLNSVDSSYKKRFDKASEETQKEAVANYEKWQKGEISKEEYMNSFYDSKEESILDEWKREVDSLSEGLKTKVDEFFRNSGYDGVVLTLDKGSFGRETQTIIALNPNQVKSATANLGTFDPSNNDIRFRFIGERGARNLDKAEEATTRLDNLAVARDMEAAFNEKKERVEKLKDSEPVEIAGDEIPFSEDLKLYKKNALEYGKTFRGNYTNKDTGESVFIGKNGLKEVLNHDYKNVEQLQSVAAIPSIIENSIYIESRKNNDSKVDAEKFDYYVCGLKIGGEDYTVRAVFVTPKDGTRYYDHKLTKIEKGNLLDSLIGTTPGFNQTDSLNSENKDTVLISILQTNDKENAKKIKMATGWERGADGKWRYEVKDRFNVDAIERFVRGAYGKTFGTKAPLERVLKDDDTLLTEYPQLKETLVKFQRLGDSWGVYYPKSNEIAINTNFIRDEKEISDRLERQKELVEQWKKPEDSKKIMDMIKVLELNPEEVLKDAEEKLVGIEGELEFFKNQMRERIETTIIHEVQHAIQHIEGFENGASVKDKNPIKVAKQKEQRAFMEEQLAKHKSERESLLKKKEELNEKMSSWYDSHENATAEEVSSDKDMQEWNRQYDDIEAELESADRKVSWDEKWIETINNAKTELGEEGYNKVAGEVEARNAARRSRSMTEEDMREYLASETEDVSREDQIFLNGALEEGTRFRRVYHGSGASFDRFDHSFMGTGEGAQAYGWGTYVTEVNGIARSYADSYNTFKSVVGDFYLRKIREGLDNGKSFQEVKQELLDHHRYLYDKAGGDTSMYGNFISDYQKLMDMEEPPSRYLYEVEIPDFGWGRYLKYDDAFTANQFNKVVKALEEKGYKNELKMNNSQVDWDNIPLRNKMSYWIKTHFDWWTGKGLYKAVSYMLGGDKEASNFLSDLGFVGIQYPANATTGGRADNAKNYVIFNENDLKIVEHTRFRLSDKGRKIQNEVDKFAEKYNSKEMVVVEVASMTDEEIEEMFDSPASEVKEALKEGLTGGYSEEEDKIYIFADNLPSQDVEDTMFHENLHGLLTNDQEIVGAFFVMAEERFPKNIQYLRDLGYKESEIPEELFIRLAAKAMDYGIFDDVIYNLPEEAFERFKEIIKEFGYGYEQEIRSRILEESGRGTPQLLEGEEIHETRRLSEAVRKEQTEESAEKRTEAIRNLFGQVADMGLKGVLGNKEYTRLMVEIYKELPEGVRSELADDSLRHYNGSIAPAVSDYVNKKGKASLWDKIAGFIREALRKVGIDLELNGNDAKYILWRSQKPLNRVNLLDVAEDINMRFRLKVGEYSDSPTDVVVLEQIKLARTEVEKNPTEAQKEAGNYKKGHITLDGYDITLENPKGGTRSGTDKNGKKWSITMNNDYGYIRGTEAVDGDHIDVFLSDNPTEGRVFVVDQSNEDGSFDESKVMYGFNSLDEARQAYLSNYEKGWENRIMAITEVSKDEFKRWIDSSHRKTKPFSEYKHVKSNGGGTRFRVDVGNKLNIRDEYEATIKKGGYQAREAVQDAMLSLRRAQELIEKASGEKLRDFENAWMHENRLSSVVQAAIHEMERKFYKPMTEAVKKLMETANIQQEQVADYLMLKHGIERNREMAVRKALTDNEGKIDRDKLNDWYEEKRRIRNDANLDTWRKKQEAMDDAALMFGADMSQDYSGLTSMFDTDDLADCTEMAYNEVEAMENAHPSETEALGKAVKALTQSTLDESFGSGLMDRKVYDELSNDMYDYYIPLRGFEETTSDEVYAYLDNERGAFNAPLKRAKGRSSKADNPLAYMKSIAESGIMQGERNKMKQSFLNMVVNHPSDLVSVREGVWAIFNPATGEWEAASFPESKVPRNATPADVEAAYEQWEADMEQRAQTDPNVKKISEAADVPYRVIGNRMNQHQVIVKRLGKSYTLTINGNPRLAMALNGLTNPNNKSNDGKVSAYVSGKIDALNRNLSAWYTTRNPDFVASNFMRDTFYTNTIVRAKEGNTYANRFHHQYAKLLMPGRMIGLFAKYENGTLDLSNPMERDFHEFMMNGGETGYSNLKDLEEIKRQIAKDVKGSRFAMLGKVADKLDLVNRAVENTARFAAYRTSRQQGRSVARSVFDAKEISVNFNKKGAGGTFFGATGQTGFGNLAAMVGAGGRAFYVFFNAAVQGTSNLMHVMKVNPIGTGAGLGAMFLMGAVIPMLLGGDDEKDYYDLPEHVRRNHLVLPYAGDSWISIPLPIEYRIMYGMGELLTSWRTGHERGSNIGKKMLSLTGQALPLNFLEEGVDAFVPSALSPIWQIYNNESWTGLPIYKDTDFNKQDPEYTKAYKNVDRLLYNFSKAMYEWTFDEENQKARIDLNPAMMETLARGYFGGLATQLSNLGKTWEMVAGEREFDWRNIPVGNRIFKSGDERTKEKRIQNEYFDNVDKMEFMQSRERLLRKTKDGASVPEADKVKAQRDYEIMQGSDVYKQYISDPNSFKNKKKQADKIYRKRKEKDSEQLEKDYFKALEDANRAVR